MLPYFENLDNLMPIFMLKYVILMYKIGLKYPQNEHFHKKMQFPNDPDFSIFGDFFSQLDFAAAYIPNILGQCFHILKCREFYSASLRIIKRVCTCIHFHFIGEKLKQNGNFNIFFSFQ